MEILFFFISLCTIAWARETPDLLTHSATISIQPISLSNPPPVSQLAVIRYNPSTLSSELSAFEVPDIPSDSKLACVGIYDRHTPTWISSTSVTSVEIFAKGYAPTVVVSLDAQGEIIGVSLKAGSIDAGRTRDFAPKVKILKGGKAKGPVLGTSKAVPEKVGATGAGGGGEQEAVVEKTFLQKYWWVILGVAFLALSGGGAEEQKKAG